MALRYAAVAAADGAVIVAGGSTPAGNASDAILRFDPATGRVRKIGRLPHPLTHAGAAVIDGMVFLVGGRGSTLSSQTAAILGVNPRTGAVLKIPAKKSPVWTAGKTLKERVEGKKKTAAAGGKKR